VIIEPATLIDRMSHIVAMAYIMNNKGPEEMPNVSYEQCLIEGYTANGLNVDKLTAKIDSLIIA
jgi:hypothetical protein